jgi:hypothetical protein
MDLQEQDGQTREHEWRRHHMREDGMREHGAPKSSGVEVVSVAGAQMCERQVLARSGMDAVAGEQPAEDGTAQASRSAPNQVGGASLVAA